MYKDIIGIIEQYSHIDLTKYEYKCENCDENCDQFNEVCCCVYIELSTMFNATYSQECDIYKTSQKYKFQYICEKCYRQMSSSDVVFFFRNLLEIESFEYLFREILQTEKNKILKKCILPHISIMQFDEEDSYKTIFTKYEFHNDSIISHNLFYESDQCLSKYFNGLSEIEKKHFKIFKVEEYLKISLN